MTEHREIDEYVRRLVPISESTIAALVDREAKARLLERITGSDGPNRTVTVPGPDRRRTRLALAGAAAGVIVLSGVAAAVVATNPSNTDRPSVAEPSRSSTTEPILPAPLGGDALCAVPEPADNEVAFDGTITEIGEDARFSAYGITYFEVTFEVHEWFYGGDAEQVTVVMPRSGAEEGSNSVGGYAVGSRRLVAANWVGIEHPVTGICSVSVPNPYVVDLWRRNFDTE